MRQFFTFLNSVNLNSLKKPEPTTVGFLSFNVPGEKMELVAKGYWHHLSLCNHDVASVLNEFKAAADTCT